MATPNSPKRESGLREVHVTDFLWERTIAHEMVALARCPFSQFAIEDSLGPERSGACRMLLRERDARNC
jgi:hypothetical protein